MKRKPKPRVKYSPLTREWFVMFQGEATWFPRWREAYDFAYLAARVRNVSADALGSMT